MKTIELLEKHPLATEVVRTWFFDQMVASFDDESVPEEFKEMMKQEGVTNERLATLIDVQPRTLFDVFDDNNIRIHIVVGSDLSADNYSFHIASDVKKTDASQGASVNGLTNDFKTRKETEIKAIIYAFELLEIKLTPIELPTLEEN